jgi:hypothetical protein
MKKQEKIEILIAKALIKGNLLDEECEILCKITISELISKYGLRLEEAKFVHKWCNSCINKNFYELVVKDNNKKINESVFGFLDNIDSSYFSKELLKQDNELSNFLKDSLSLKKNTKKYNKPKLFFGKKHEDIFKQIASEEDIQILNTKNKQKIKTYLENKYILPINNSIEKLFNISKYLYGKNTQKAGLFGKLNKKSRSKKIQDLNNNFSIKIKNNFLTESEGDSLKWLINNKGTLKNQFSSENEIIDAFEKECEDYEVTEGSIESRIKDIFEEDYTSLDQYALYLIYLIHDSSLINKYFASTFYKKQFFKNLKDIMKQVFDFDLDLSRDTQTGLDLDDDTYNITYGDYAAFIPLIEFYNEHVDIIVELNDTKTKAGKGYSSFLSSILSSINANRSQKSKMTGKEKLKSLSKRNFYYFFCLVIKNKIYKSWKEYSSIINNFYS